MKCNGERGEFAEVTLKNITFSKDFFVRSLRELPLRESGLLSTDLKNNNKIK